MKFLTTQEAVETYRALADFLEAHPLVPVPNDLNYGWVRTYVPSSMSADKAKEVLRSVGSFTKAFEDERMLAQVQCGHVTLDILVEREKVCVRKVVGTKKVAASVIPSQFTPERVIPEHDEDIVEWDCKPILAPEGYTIMEKVQDEG